MKKSVESQIILHAPNLINICVDESCDGVISGRIYHCYMEEPKHFENVVKMMEIMEHFFDAIGYPQASTQSRNFANNKTVGNAEVKKLKTPDEIAGYRGKKCSFLTYVQYRQNSTWQGQVEWAETGVVKSFQSELDLMKLINGAVED